MITLSLTIALSFLAQDPLSGDTPRAVRLADVDGDGALDRMLFDADGGLRVALRVSGRDFAEVVQELPRVPVETVLLPTDLDGDGHMDLFLVTSGPNVALIGDGSGRFVDATEELGLRDGGDGLGVERIDVDGDGWDDLLLHNRAGDVVFHGTGAGFERDPATPERPRLVGTRAHSTPAPTRETALPGPSVDGPQRPHGTGRRAVVTSPRGSSGARISAAPSSTAGSVAPLSLAGGGTATSLVDMTSGQRVRLDTTPTLGRLLPLGPELFVDGDGDVGMGTLTPTAALHVEGTSPSGIGLQVSDRLTVRTDFPFTGVGRAAPLTSSETFGVHAPTTGWGGMYVNTEGVTGQPYYGYATDGTPRAWTYFHVPSAEWRVWNGADRLTVASDGDTHVAGDLSQAAASDGLVKAAVVVNDNSATSPSVVRYFNNLPGGSAVTVSDGGTGVYGVDFGVDVATRFVQASITGPSLAGGDTISVWLQGSIVTLAVFDAGGNVTDASFQLLLY